MQYVFTAVACDGSRSEFETHLYLSLL